MRLKIISTVLIMLALIAGGIFFFLQRTSDDQEPQEEVLALGQEEIIEGSDGDIEVDEVVIVKEDDSQKYDEIDPKEHHFVLSVATSKLSIESPVVDGVSEGSLARGIGRHVTTANPSATSGNVVLSGHQWFPGNRPAHSVFENLDQLEIGEEVELKYGSEIFRYKIRDSKIVEPTDVSILEQTDSPQLTLYTCYPKYTTDQRLVYVADLIDVREEDVVVEG